MTAIRKPAKLILIGGKPPPAGGVTSHVDDLLARMADDPNSPEQVSLIECYRHRDKSDSEPNVHYLHGGLGSCLGLLLGYSGIIHMHVSTGERMVPLLLVFRLLAPLAKIILTFHHGDLAFHWGKQPFWRRLVTRAALQMTNRIVCVSENQADLMARYRNKSAIRVVNSYIRRTAGETVFKPSTKNVLPADARKCKWVASSSGYAVPSYGFDQIIETLDELRSKGHDIGLCLVLYGTPDEQYLAGLRKRVETLDWVWILPELSRDEFRGFLGETDVYLRATRADSFGLAVCEAMEEGTPVIASDVCERGAGAIVYPVDDQAAFSRAILKVLLEEGNGDGASQAGCDNYSELMDVYLGLS
jgi:glycosyltransferase involved in cell wall biosynthesis